MSTSCASPASPNFSPKASEAESEGNVAFDVNFEVYPEVKIKALDALEIERAATQVGDVRSRQDGRDPAQAAHPFSYQG